MADIRATLSEYGKRRIALTFTVLVVLAFFLLQTWKAHVFLIAGWFESGLGLYPSELGQDLLHVGHRLHEVALSLMALPLLFGLAAQIRSPTRHVTGMLMAVCFFVAGLIAIAVTGFWRLVIILAVLGVPTVIAAVLHPAGRDLVASIDSSRVNRVLLALVVVAAVPLLAYAAIQIGLQTGAIEPASHDHAGGEHEKIHKQHVEGKCLPVGGLITFMETNRLLYSPTLWRRVGIVMGFGGILLLFIGLGTALDYMVAQSHPIGARRALLLRAEYTVAGVFFIISGFGLALKVSDSTVATDHDSN